MDIIRKLNFLLGKSQKRRITFIFLLMLIAMVFESLGVALIIPLLLAITQPNIIDTYPILGEISSILGIDTQKQLIVATLLTLVIVYVIKSAFLIYSGWIKGKFTANLKVNISRRLFSIYMHQPYTFHLQRNSAQLIRNVTGEVFELVSTFSSVIQLLSEILIIIGIGILLFMVEPVGLISIILTITFFGSLFYLLTKGRTFRLGKERRAHEIKILQHLQQGLGGFKDAKLLGREVNFINQFVDHAKKSAKVSIIYGVLTSLPRHMFELLSVLIMVVFVLIILFISDKDIGSIVPILGVFAMAAFRIMPSATGILMNIQGLRYNLVVINRLYDEMLLPIEEVISNDEKIQINDINDINEIYVNSVRYLYPSTVISAIDYVDLRINVGSTIGFIGPSGAGKSTLIDIILGLLKPTKGKILVNGIDIQNNLRTWQNHIGYVPQSIYLTDDTLRKNIAFGIPEEMIDDKAIEDAIRQSQIQEFVQSLPENDNTMVGENGVRLSGGQRQRIGIARALYHNPSILVFDEATSALDNVIEKDVMETIESLHGNKTIIIIAHRISTLKNCDCIYKLNKGAIVEQGDYNKMVNFA
jgi:ABC-type multidrug transport system fused ATPase/permease subunit